MNVRNGMNFKFRKIATTLPLLAMACLSACVVGPKYHKPAVDAPPSYKEATPSAQSAQPAPGAPAPTWQPASPNDAMLKGKWWEIYNDADLNKLEEEVNVSNQSVKAAEASFLGARALVKQARAAYFPTIGVSPSITATRQLSVDSNGKVTGGTGTDFDFPANAAWVPDIWGKVRNQVRAQASAAQMSAADLENIRLSLQVEVANNYFQLRSQDALKDLLDATVKAYQESVDLTQALYETGIDSQESVLQAETQLATAQAQDTNVGILRAQYEHAIAMLIGKPASQFSLAHLPLSSEPPSIPIGVPSNLLERRPDIASAERSMEQSNALIGVAVAAYYPNVTLSGTFGFRNTSIADWFTWPSHYWSVGPQLAQTIFEGGLRKATVVQAQAQYDQSVANYRQTVLTAFQQVEDNLAALRILSQEVQQQAAAVDFAQKNLNLAIDRYKLGIDPYLNVLTAQTTLFSNQQGLVQLKLQQMNASAQLIEALGGGWDTSLLPSKKDVQSLGPVQTNPAPPSQSGQNQTPPTR
ncbi:efflux transporter outer membrane subunit [Candidatus Korobacter versatilis]|nr:efflux transporter outer membrane subunit [Candidatus Koribacter versatilis]